LYVYKWVQTYFYYCIVYDNFKNMLNFKLYLAMQLLNNADIYII